MIAFWKPIKVVQLNPPRHAALAVLAYGSKGYRQILKFISLLVLPSSLEQNALFQECVFPLAFEIDRWPCVRQATIQILLNWYFDLLKT